MISGPTSDTSNLDVAPPESPCSLVQCHRKGSLAPCISCSSLTSWVSPCACLYGLGTWRRGIPTLVVPPFFPAKIWLMGRVSAASVDTSPPAEALEGLWAATNRPPPAALSYNESAAIVAPAPKVSDFCFLAHVISLPAWLDASSRLGLSFHCCLVPMKWGGAHLPVCLLPPWSKVAV